MGSGLINVDASIGELLSGAGQLAKDIRTAITGRDPELEAKLDEFTHLANMGQIDINKKEAEHPSLFVSGWRPAVGWVCVFGLGYHFIVNRLLEWIAAIAKFSGEVPTFEVEGLLTLLLALLGLGGMRSYEKKNGVARSVWTRVKKKITE